MRARRRVAIAAVVLTGATIAVAVIRRRAAHSARRITTSRQPVRSAAHPVLLINPNSGDGTAADIDLADVCAQRGIEAITVEPGADLAELAADAIKRGADAIGMAGGDGSQALVAAVAARHDVAYVVVPAGTRNHLALDLGLDRNDLVGALDAFGEAIEYRIDLAEVNGHPFVNNATIGLYATAVHSDEYREAKGRVTASVLSDHLADDAPHVALRFAGPDGAARESADVILVANNPYELRGPTRGTRERLDRGLLGIVVTHLESASDLARLLALGIAGQADRFEGLEEWTAASFRVDADEPVEIAVDGEALTLDPPLTFSSEQRALRVRVPQPADRA